MARSTSAAPTFFPPGKARAANGETYALVDGALYANNPALCAWVEAHDAWYAIGSDYNAGMGGKDAVPFSDEKAARSFTAAHGGTVVRFNEIPEKYILESDESDDVADVSAGVSILPKAAVKQ